MALPPPEESVSFVLASSDVVHVPGEQWALERGPLIQDRYSYGPPQVSAEVALAVRGPGWLSLRRATGHLR